MKRLIISLFLLGSFTALSTMEASAVVCAAGVYRAGCVGPRGAAVVGHRHYYNHGYGYRARPGAVVIRR
jgi:hypothetical protein